MLAPWHQPSSAPPTFDHLERNRERRRILERGRRIELHPANPAFSVLLPEPGQCQLLGRVIEVRRFLEAGLHDDTAEDFAP